MFNYKSKNSGFTLLELSIVIVIAAILSTITYMALAPAKKIGASKNAVRSQDAQAIEKGIKTALLDNDILPTAITDITTGTYYSLVTSGASTSGTYTCNQLGQDINRLDIASTIEPYIGTMPIDTDISSGVDTGYYLIRTANLFDIGNCNSSIYCGDNICNNSETVLTCAVDCPASCGDTYCTHTETCSSCSADCGACSNSSPIVSDVGRWPANTSEQLVSSVLYWTAWTDPDSDTIEYYTEVWQGTQYCNGGGGLKSASGWSTATSYDATPFSDGGTYSWYTKARSQGYSDDTAYNTCYFWINQTPAASCPFIYLWNGKNYDYITDIQGQTIGFPVDFPKSKRTKFFSSIQIPLNNYQSDKGIYKLKIRESLDEMDYFDELKLLLVDHPKGYDIYSATIEDYIPFKGKKSEETLYTVKDPRLPISATDSDGKNVLFAVSQIDNILAQDYVDPNSYINLDFGKINPHNAKLVIDGWSVYQVNRARNKIIMPYVEVVNEKGEWEKVRDFGFSKGDLKTMIIDLSDKFLTDDYRIRLHFGWHVGAAALLDRIRIDDSEPVNLDIKIVDLKSANLYHAGRDSYKTVSLDNRIMNVKDASLNDSINNYFYGNFTKYGDVKELLDKADDKFVIFRHGDAIDVTFKDGGDIKEGYERTPIIFADVFYKIIYDDKAGRFKKVDNPRSMYPLPFKAMSQYPYDTSIENYPYDDEHNEYLDKWNTRVCEEGNAYCYDLYTGYRVLTPKQKQELDIAQQRIQNGIPSPASKDGLYAGDIANIEYAKKYYGYLSQ